MLGNLNYTGNQWNTLEYHGTEKPHQYHIQKLIHSNFHGANYKIYNINKA